MHSPHGAPHGATTWVQPAANVEHAAPSDSVAAACAVPAVAPLEERLWHAVEALANLGQHHRRQLLLVREFERGRAAAAFVPVLDGIDAALQGATTEPGAGIAGLAAVRERALAVMASVGRPSP